jgi:hypothetical protein
VFTMNRLDTELNEILSLLSEKVTKLHKWNQQLSKLVISLIKERNELKLSISKLEQRILEMERKNTPMRNSLFVNRSTNDLFDIFEENEAGETSTWNKKLVNADRTQSYELRKERNALTNGWLGNLLKGRKKLNIFQPISLEKNIKRSILR